MDWIELREPISACSHGLGMLLAVPGTWLLWRQSNGERSKQVSLLIFGLTLIYCYGASFVFHAVRAQEWVPFCCKLDHVGIYLLIAGTYTPTAVVILYGAWRIGILTMAWSLAFVGIVMRLSTEAITPSISTTYYLVMGWGAILMYFELARILSRQALRPVVFGGVLYSVGALINLARWPDLAPPAFGHHELFHIFALAASLTHFWFMAAFVVPFRRREVLEPVAAVPALETGAASRAA